MNKFLSWLAHVTGWYNTWLSTRVLVLLGFITAGLLGGLLYLSSIGFRQDKLAYIYDLQDLQTETLVTRLRDRLEDEAKLGTHYRIHEEPSALSEYGIPRLPDGREIFIAQRGTERLLLWRDASGVLKMKPLDKQFNPFTEKDGRAYWVTSFGVFLSATKVAQVNETNFAQRNAVKEFLKSKLTSGLVTVEDNASQTIAAFREIPNTNVIVFVETSLQEALAPFQRFLRGALLLGGGVIVFGIMLTWFVLSTLWRPVTRVAEITSDIASGKYDVDSSYQFRDELSIIFKGLGSMARKLKSREQSLIQLQRNLEQILSTTLEMALAEDKLIVVRSALKAIMRTIQVVPTSGASVTFFAGVKEERLVGKKFIIAERGAVLALAKQTANDDPHIDSGEASSVLVAKPACFIESGQLVIPVVSGARMLAKITIDEYAQEQVSTVDKVFVDTLAASMAVAFENLLLRESAAIKVRLESELATAQAVQANLLPEEIKIPGLDIATFYRSSEQTGGDWLGHYFDENSNTVFFYIGDVTGHGVASALLTGVACGAVYGSEFTTENHELNSFGRSLDPSIRLSILANVLNRVLAQTGKGNLLMTMAIFSLNLTSGALAYISAGHTPLFVIKKSEKKFEVIPNGGSILGLSKEGQFEVKHSQLERGDSLLLYTDGLVENTGPRGEVLKLKKVLKALAESSEADAPTLLKTILTHAELKWRGAQGKDDVSVVVLKWDEAQLLEVPAVV